MKVRCKVRCVAIEQIESWTTGPERFLWSAKFGPANRSASPENAEFFAATPSISMTIATIKSDHFKVGQEYFLDFTPAD